MGPPAPMVRRGQADSVAETRMGRSSRVCGQALLAFLEGLVSTEPEAAVVALEAELRSLPAQEIHPILVPAVAVEEAVAAGPQAGPPGKPVAGHSVFL